MLALAAVCVVVPAGLLALVLVRSDDDAGPPAGVSAPGAVAVGERAPDFTLATLDGGEVALHELRGTPTVLTFWASWCAPCREELPLLQEASEEHPDDLHVIGVVFNDLERDARAFRTEVGATFPAPVDPDGAVAEAYGVVGIPQTLFIDATGVVRDRVFGITTRDALNGPLEALLR